MMEAVKKYLLSKPGFLLCAALVSFGLFVPSNFAHATFLTSLLDIADLFFGIFFWSWILVVKLGTSILIMLLGFLPAYLSAVVLQIVLSDKLIILPYTSGGIVDIGWVITRDLANLAFIAILIVIAVRTMLQGKGIELLPKLIGIALIVNFTKVIAGVVVDIANILTNYFLTPAAGIGSSMVVNLFGKETPIWQLIGGFMAILQGSGADGFRFLVDNFSITGAIGDMIGGIAIIIVGWILSFTFLVFAAIFFVRYIVIWIIVIFAPLAFAAMILPETAKYAKQWWSALTKWAFMGIGPAFILFLTAKIIEKKNDLFGAYQNQIFTENQSFFVNLFRPFYSILNELLFWAVIIIFMWIGLTLTLKMNTQVSKLMVKGGMKALGAAANWAKGRAAQKWGGGAQKWLEERAKGRFARMPVVGGAVRAATKFAAQKIRDAERLKEAQGEAAKMTDGMLSSQLAAETDPIKRKALIEEKIKRGDAKDIPQLLSEDQMRATVKGLSLRDLEKDIISAFPQYANESRNVEQQITDPLVKQFYDNRIKELDDNGQLTPETQKQARRDAINAQYVKSRTKEKARLIQDAALQDPGVFAGLLMNKNVEMFADIGTTSQRLDKVIAGYRSSYGADANKKLARLLLGRGQGIENISSDELEKDEGALLQEMANSAEYLTVQGLGRIARSHGAEYVNRVFRMMSVEQLEKLKNKTPMKNLMPPDVAGWYSNPKSYTPPKSAEEPEKLGERERIVENIKRGLAAGEAAKRASEAGEKRQKQEREQIIGRQKQEREQIIEQETAGAEAAERAYEAGEPKRAEEEKIEEEVTRAQEEIARTKPPSKERVTADIEASQRRVEADTARRETERSAQGSRGRVEADEQTSRRRTELDDARRELENLRKIGVMRTAQQQRRMQYLQGRIDASPGRRIFPT